MDSTNVIVGAVVTLLLGLAGLANGGAIVNFYKTYKGEKRTDDSLITGNWEKINDRTQARADQLELDLAELRKELSVKVQTAEMRERECTLKFERVYTYMRYLASICKAAKVDVMPFDPDASSMHIQLPPL